jgi:hypoxanthine phosphoribosyltransferase
MSHLTIENMDFAVLIDAERIRERVRELGSQISRDYKGLNPILMIVLNGGFIFAADLMRQLEMPCEVDFIKISSYGDELSSSGEVKMKKDYDSLVSGRHLLVIEDIVDSGLSLSFLKQKFELQHPASVKFATLLHKPDNSTLDFSLDYVGFEIGPEFVIGYGLDYKQNWRNLPAIHVRVDGREEETAQA